MHFSCKHELLLIKLIFICVVFLGYGSGGGNVGGGGGGCKFSAIEFIVFVIIFSIFSNTGAQTRLFEAKIYVLN